MTPIGHFKYLVMSFGLTNAPAVFQALINDVLQDMVNRFVFVYLDNILIFSSSLEEHREHVRLVLQRLFLVGFMAYITTQEQLRPHPAKIQVVTEWPVPTSRKEIQRFLRIKNFYKQLIRDYTRFVSPLTCLPLVSSPFQWSPEAAFTFSRLKLLFTTAPVLRHRDPSLQFVVEVNAFDSGARAVLSQRNPVTQRLHPCAFFSHRFSPAERKYYSM